MKLSQFNFDLPQELVALYPHSFVREFTNDDGTKGSFRVARPDEARLMVLHKDTGEIEMFRKDAKGKPTKDFLQFRDIINYFDEGDTFVMNDTKVFNARLYGTKEKTDAKIEVFVLRELNEETHLWDVLVEPARKIRIGNKLFFDDAGVMVAEVYDNTTSRGRSLRFLYDCSHEQFKHDLFALGEAPLPVYVLNGRPEDPDMHGMHVHSHATEDDKTYFQTVFAKNVGAVTAPSTNLHFTRELLKRMEIRGINSAFITLHCGLSNFTQIEVEDLSKHKMESEQMIVGREACDTVNKTKEAGHRVCVIGNSMAKAAETAVGTDGRLKEYDGWTSKFIFPPYVYHLPDAMCANFYHPESTMMMSTAAFGGYDNVMECYRLAVKNKYQFGCFGDSLLIV